MRKDINRLTFIILRNSLMILEILIKNIFSYNIRNIWIDASTKESIEYEPEVYNYKFIVV